MGGCVLIVEDDVPMARAIRRMVELLTDGEGVVAPSCAVARELLASLHTWRGALIDKCLPDGDGLDVLAELRCLHRELPALVLTGVCSHEVAERARALGARYVVKPPLAEEVSDFVRATARQETAPFETSLRAAVARLGNRCGLARRARDVLYELALDDRREVAAAALGMSLSTLRTHLTVIGERTGAEDARQLGALVRAEALEEPKDGRRPLTWRSEVFGK